MKLPPSLTTVTLFSKLLAVILFFTFILAGFFVGMKYQAAIDLIKYQQTNLVKVKPSPKPTPTCIPRPACLDATPRCMIPETSDMCPRATPTPGNNPIACTMEAKLCPDGKTYVGRTGPKCEFSPCP
ncbi:MAG: hypothetical protein HW400_376 [Candidatus Levybacteria bacterium]|nr:hypothetical protein [Candidatus Levybacteria bacterium]